MTDMDETIRQINETLARMPTKADLYSRTAEIILVYCFIIAIACGFIIWRFW